MPEQSTDKQAAGHEPDYRYTLANERTFLAWIRTALALLAGAVAIVQLVPDFGVPGGRKLIAALLSLISIAVIAGGAMRWHASQQAMRLDAPLPSTLMPWLLAIGIAVVGLVVLVLTVIFGVVSNGG